MDIPPKRIRTTYELEVPCESCKQTTSITFRCPTSEDLNAQSVLVGMSVQHCARCWDEFDKSLAESYAEPDG
jgi:hypothetical protein